MTTAPGAIGAVMVHLAMSARGATALSTADFVPAFLMVGLAASLSGLVYLRLPADAGAEVSGHGAAPARQAR